MEEEKVLQHVIAGDSDAYRTLVERYQTGLIIHCENLMNDREEGEDIAQDAFVKAYQTLATFDCKKARFSTWLYHIATNMCIDTLRKNKRKVSVTDIESLLDSPEPDYMQQEENRQLQRIIQQLEPPKYSEIIRAYFWEGKSYQQLAVEYDTSTNTIGTWMRRAKSQLKEKLS
jgi:RNA polymerase sigma-70 factor (ECF subfamily)